MSRDVDVPNQLARGCVALLLLFALVVVLAIAASHHVRIA